MSTHIFRLPEAIESELNTLVDSTDLPKSYFLLEALKAYIREHKDMLRNASLLEKSTTSESTTQQPLDSIVSEYKSRLK